MWTFLGIAVAVQQREKDAALFAELHRKLQGQVGSLLVHLCIHPVSRT